MKNFVLGVFTILIICVSTSMPLSARMSTLPGFEDVRGLAIRAPLVFRGQVVDVKFANPQAETKDGVAIILVDRWYRGSSSDTSVNLHFVYDPAFGVGNGHNCRDLEIGSYWIVFAKPAAGEVLEMYDDCDGALTVSSLLGPKTSGDALSQMEEDFAAGLNDFAADIRIASTQRLAGLGKLRSTEALHRVIAAGSEEECKWAIFAALKTGDTSTLPLAVPLLLNLYHEETRVHREPNGFTYTEGFPYPQPEASMALAISKLRAPEAVPGVTRLANEASDSFVRNCAKEALLEIKRLAARSKK